MTLLCAFQDDGIPATLDVNIFIAMDDGTRISEEVEAFLRAARAKSVDTCAAMLNKNPNLVDCIEAGGFSALHFAAFNGDLQLIDLLVSFKANVEVTNYDGNTPMMMAAKVKQQAAIRRLVDAGASVNFATKSGCTAAHFAASMGDLDTVRYLVSLSATTLHDRSETGSLLHWAAHSGDVATVGAMLYEFNIPVDIKDAHGGTALFTALFMKKNEIVQFLLEHGANPNTVIDGDLSTPLHIAVEHGGVEDVKLLLAFGADPMAANKENDTPLTLAQKQNNKSAIKELSKPVATKEKRAEDAARFKAHGNKVFVDGENVKAAKFYSLAIQLDPTNHVFFSNRAACYFNQRYHTGALLDAERCIAIAPKWAKGYFRRGATLFAMGKIEAAAATVAAGLALDPANNDLKTLKAEIEKPKQ